MGMRRLRRASGFFVLALALIGSGGCGLVKPMLLKSVANTLSGPGGVVNSHNDPDTVEGALDFALLTNESILAQIPEHEPLLVATCSQYTQYAFGFIQPKAEALQFDDFEKSQVLSARAFRLAVRGRDYCWRALEVKFKGITARLKADPVMAVRKARREHVPLLYWSAASLGAAISLGGVDHPELTIDWPIVRALAERALELDETWNRGALHELLITVEGQGETLGGSEERARKHFARAVEIQQGLSPGPYVALAMSWVKGHQLRDEFEKLLKQAIDIDPEKDPANRLPTLLTRQRATVLLAHIDEIILKHPGPDARPALGAGRR
jgi:hypothetical protein